jgi:alpha-maltose-1-phosphate synthase
MNSPPRTLSIMEDYLGHLTNGLNMRKYFHEFSSYKDIDFYWFKEERELLTKLLMRPFHTSFPNRWVCKNNLDFSRFRRQTALAYTARRLIARKLRNSRYTSMHLSTQVMGYYAIDFMRKIPTVVVIDITSKQASEEMCDPKFRWTYQPNIFLDKRVFDAAKYVVTLSEWARQSVIHDSHISPDKVLVIPYGVDIKKIPNANLRSKDSNLTCKILFIGGDFRRKGGEDLLDVFLASFSDVAELHIVTQVPLDCNHCNVFVYNSVKAYSAEWVNLLQNADLFVMPTYADAFATVYMEAMAAGLPIIATSLPQVTEVVIDGLTGLLVKPGDRKALADKIRYLINHPEQRLQMGENGKKLAEQKFNYEINFQKLELILKSFSSQ